MSGMAYGGKVIAHHTVTLHWCSKNKSLTAYCPTHSSRIFVSYQDFVAYLLEEQNGSTQPHNPPARRTSAK
jgi:hypothetical protein